MIYGIGTDIIKIDRIAAALARNGDRFAGRILGDEEMAKFKDRSARVPARGISFLATRFAAKEAFSKAIGLGMRMPMTWRSMQVLNAPGGKPVVVLSGALLAWFTEQGLRAHVTITDEVEYGVAFVIVEK
ncbi:holo-ACP synthase [Oxalobacteraceae bacterium CAVE-383]|nr:holo-ACP synthase [Oxalobacteraceae bacterium CAVE-383]